MRVVIVEDEQPATDELIHLLGAFPGVDVVGTAENGLTGLQITRELKPDVVFLDIEMPGLSGLDIAERLLESASIPDVVLVTAYDTFALKAFEVRATDYLVKPVHPARLAETISHLLANRRTGGSLVEESFGGPHSDAGAQQPTDGPLLSVPAGDRYIPIRAAEIVMATTEGRHVLLVTDKGEFRLPETFSDLVDLLSADVRFFQCHRAYVVNVKRIISVELWSHSTFQLQVERTDLKVPVSRSRVSAFREIMRIGK